ncbi:MAG: hypothetical protein ACLFVO_06310 [Chloroflexaceae bacterium]
MALAHHLSGIAAFYYVVWPKDAAPADRHDLRYIILRWFHSLVWLLLALSTGIRMSRLPNKKRVAGVLEMLAASTYIAFLIVLITANKQ